LLDYLIEGGEARSRYLLSFPLYSTSIRRLSGVRGHIAELETEKRFNSFANAIHSPMKIHLPLRFPADLVFTSCDVGDA
jgi:hypothetical protein